MFVGCAFRIHSQTYRHKKRLSIPDSQSFVNLKSNTMKNTLRRYGLSAYLQIFGKKQPTL